MIIDWPLACVIVAALAAVAWLARPFVVGRSTEQAREAVLADITKRLNAVEGHIMTNTRKMPGRL